MCVLKQYNIKRDSLLSSTNICIVTSQLWEKPRTQTGGAPPLAERHREKSRALSKKGCARIYSCCASPFYRGWNGGAGWWHHLSRTPHMPTAEPGTAPALPARAGAAIPTRYSLTPGYSLTACTRGSCTALPKPPACIAQSTLPVLPPSWNLASWHPFASLRVAGSKMLKHCLPGHLLSQNLGGAAEELEKPSHGEGFPLPMSQVPPSHQEEPAA